MPDRFAEALWPARDLPQLLDALARKAGLDMHSAQLAGAPAELERLPAWLESACQEMGVETEATEVWGFRIEAALRTAAPALVPMTGCGWTGLLAIRGGDAVLVRPDLALARVPLTEFARALYAEHREPYCEGIDRLLDECAVAPRRRERARDALLRERLRGTLVATVWPLRTPPGASFRRQLADAGLLRRAATLMAAHLAEYFLWIAAWYILGRQALTGRLDLGWLAAWALALATMIPFRLWTTWTQGAIAISGGGMLRQRLLDGALQLAPEEMRREGAGRFLGRAIETESIDFLALSGAALSALAGIELIVAACVLMAGAAGGLQALALAVWTAAVLALAWRYYRLRGDWTSARLSMTHELVERMTGHRTRLAQEPSAEWHLAEDQAMQQYLTLSMRMDRASARLTGLAPRAWLLAGIAALVPAFLGESASPGALAVSIGGVLLGWQAFRRLAAGVASLAGAAISWRQAAPIFHASARSLKEDSVSTAAAACAAPASVPVVDAREVTFGYAGRERRILDGVNLEIRRGDWILLEGESGGGKSTLVSVLAGLRTPDSGLLLAGGLDYRTLGSRAWRRRVAVAPQHHENHVFSGSFAFNLLMGRMWPAGESEIREAGQICRELGLGALLERMPGGIMQMVGETGWQLSQGERSRMFLARALLQNPELVALDESFGSLDPENLRQCLECVLRRTNALLVVAHP